MPIDQNELLQALRNGALVNALNGLPIPPALAMSMDGGVVVFGRNELATYATEDDPAAFRGGSITGGLVKFSGNLLVEHPEGWIIWKRMVNGQEVITRFREEELVLLQFKMDERVRDLPVGDPARYTGEVTLHIRNGALPQDGDDMVKILQARHDGVEFYVPISAPALGSTGRESVVSPDGRFCTLQQGDGNLVTYRRDPVNGALGEALWSTGVVVQ